MGQPKVGVRSGDGRARLLEVNLHNSAGPARVFQVGEALFLRIGLQKNAPLPDLTVGFLVRDRLGNDVFGTNTWHVRRAGSSDLETGERRSCAGRCPN